ncbi:biotin transport system substrate-specific component [Lachnospiraceae bacterium RM5]|nr:biotin transport system substrate-specific component [Lachnospiraceae bacterium RM5]
MEEIIKSTTSEKIRNIVAIGLMSAFLCVLGPVSLTLPFTPVPISLTIFAIYMCIYLVGWKKSLASLLTYILLGTIGLPVFSGFSGGLAKVTGPTGGYIFGFIFICIISGYVITKHMNNYFLCALSMIAGTAICYMFGTLWLAYFAHMTLKAALYAGVIPFISADLVKIIVALIIGPAINKRIKDVF